MESKTTVMAPAVAAFLGKAHNHAGQNALAVEMLEAAIQKTEAMHIMVQQPLRTVYLSEAYNAAGRWNKSLRVAQRALSLAESQGEETSRAYALRQIGLLATARGRPEDQSTSLRSLREALTLAEELRLLPLVARCRYDLARALDRTGASLEAEAERHKADAGRFALGMEEW
jgi:tetratricopeptide (TPR) repeat protein